MNDERTKWAVYDKRRYGWLLPSGKVTVHSHERGTWTNPDEALDAATSARMDDEAVVLVEVHP